MLSRPLHLVSRVAVLGLAVAGCGEMATSEHAVSSRAPVRASATTAVVSHRHTAPATRKRRWKSCDSNIQTTVGASCAFAENVFYGTWMASQSGRTAFQAYSPVTHRSYAVSCANGQKVSCHASNGNRVRFSSAALDSYDASQAARYCAAHPVSAAGTCRSSPPAPSPAPAPSEPANCDPSYEGACLDPNSADYDCDGGSGNGPDYTGTVTIVGDDHYGLDRDGDGIGCE